MWWKRNKVRLALEMDEQAAETIDRLMDASGARDPAEVMRDALALYEWARVQTSAGMKVGSFAESQPAREVVLPFKRSQVLP